MSQIIAEASAPYPGSDILIDSGRTSDPNATVSDTVQFSARC